MVFVHLNTFPLLAIILTVHVDQQRKNHMIICGKSFSSRPFCTRGVLLGILGGGVTPGSPNPDLISGPKMSFSHTRFQARPLKSIKLRKLPVFRLACVAAGPCTRLNRLHSLSALYTEGLERLRRRQFQTWSLRNYVIIA